jgi:hypothetical protein
MARRKDPDEGEVAVEEREPVKTARERLAEKRIEKDAEEIIGVLDRIGEESRTGLFRVKKCYPQPGKGPLWSYKAEIDFGEVSDYHGFLLNSPGLGDGIYRLEAYDGDRKRIREIPTLEIAVGDPLGMDSPTPPAGIEPELAGTLEHDPEYLALESKLEELEEATEKSSERRDILIQSITSAMPFLSSIVLAWIKRPREGINEFLLKSAIEKSNTAPSSQMGVKEIDALLTVYRQHMNTMLRETREQALENASNAEPDADPNSWAGVIGEALKALSGTPMPTGQMPTGTSPTGQMPTGQMPTGQMPTGQMSTGTSPTGSGAIAPRNRAIDMIVDYLAGTLDMDEAFVIEFCKKSLTEEDNDQLRTLVKTPDPVKKGQIFNYFFTSHPRFGEISSVLVQNRERLTNLIIAYVEAINDDEGVGGVLK